MLFAALFMFALFMFLSRMKEMRRLNHFREIQRENVSDRRTYQMESADNVEFIIHSIDNRILDLNIVGLP